MPSLQELEQENRLLVMAIRDKVKECQHWQDNCKILQAEDNYVPIENEKEKI